MSQRVESIYENGLLRPLEPLALPERSRVLLEVRLLGSEQLAPVTSDETAA